MNINELYSLALSFLGETPDEGEYREHILPWVNLLLLEALPYENAYRKARGLELLGEAPYLADFSALLPYCQEITGIALPYALAGLMFQEDDQDKRAERYRAMYISALSEAACAWEEKISDAYGGDLDG